MKRFKQFLQEAIQNYKYKMPKDKEELMMDFYTLSTVAHLESNIHDGELQYVFIDVKKQMLQDVKKHLLEAVFFSVAAEMRHIYDRVQDSYEFIEKWAKKKGHLSVLKTYNAIFRKIQGHDFPESDIPNKLARRKERFKEDKKSYQNSYRALKSKKDDESAMKFAKDVFNELDWSSAYGGTPWGDIADGWLTLYNASQEGDLIKYIDHIYDLQHNTDTVFNKLRAYYKSGYSWVLKALDFKARELNPFKVWEKGSVGFKSFIARIIKATTGQSAEMALKNNLRRGSETAESGAGNVGTPATEPKVMDYNKESGILSSDDFIGRYVDADKGKIKYNVVKEVKGDLDLSDFKISKIENLPETINGNLDLSNNKITVMEKLPKSIKGNLELSNNKISKIDVTSHYISGNILLINNKIDSIEELKKIPDKIIYSKLDITGNPIKKKHPNLTMDEILSIGKPLPVVAMYLKPGNWIKIKDNAKQVVKPINWGGIPDSYQGKIVQIEKVRDYKTYGIYVKAGKGEDAPEGFWKFSNDMVDSVYIENPNK